MPVCRFLVVAALAVATVACADADPDPVVELRTELAAATDATEQLTARVEALEGQLSDLLADDEAEDGEDPLQELADSLAALTGRLDVIDEQLAAETDARERVAAEAGETASDIRSSLERVRAGLDALTGQVDELRVLYETLRDRLDNHSHS